MDKMRFDFPPIEPTQEFFDSLIPYPRDIIEALPVPKKIKTFLMTTGLPVHTKYFFWAGLSFTFYEQPRTVNFCSCKKDNYLVIGELGYDSKTDSLLGVNINRGGVHSLHEHQHIMPYTQFFNSDIEKFIQCLGCWQVFSPVVWHYEDQLEKQGIWPFDYEDGLYAPIKEKIAQIDAKAIKKPRKDQLSWWPDVCCVDAGA